MRDFDWVRRFVARLVGVVLCAAAMAIVAGLVVLTAFVWGVRL